MHLALGGARADRSPADEARDILRRDHVEKLGAGGNAHLGQVEQQMPRLAQAVVDLERLVEVGIVDEALPAERGARLFEVHAHDEAELLRELGDGVLQQLGILTRCLGVVNGAGADDDKQAIVLAVEDVDDLVAGLEDGGGGLLGDRQLFFKKNRRENDFGPGYAKVICGIEHRSHLSMESEDAVASHAKAAE